MYGTGLAAAVSGNARFFLKVVQTAGASPFQFCGLTVTSCQRPRVDVDDRRTAATAPTPMTAPAVVHRMTRSVAIMRHRQRVRTQRSRTMGFGCTSLAVNPQTPWSLNNPNAGYPANGARSVNGTHESASQLSETIT